MRDEPRMSERCFEDFDATFSRLCFKPSSPHSRPFSRKGCSPFEEIASCWSQRFSPTVCGPHQPSQGGRHLMSSRNSKSNSQGMKTCGHVAGTHGNVLNAHAQRDVFNAHTGEGRGEYGDEGARVVIVSSAYPEFAHVGLSRASEVHHPLVPKKRTVGLAL